MLLWRGIVLSRESWFLWGEFVTVYPTKVEGLLRLTFIVGNSNTISF